MISYHMFFKAGIFGLFERFQQKDFWYWNLPFDYDAANLRRVQRQRLANKREFGVNEDHALYYCGSVLSYFSHKSLYTTVVVYENLLRYPNRTVWSLFLALGIDNLDQAVLAAVSVLERNSQNNLFGDTKKNRHDRVISRDNWKRVENVFRQVEVPFALDIDLDDFFKLLNEKEPTAASADSDL